MNHIMTKLICAVCLLWLGTTGLRAAATDRLLVGAAVADITPTSFPLTRAPKVTITGVLDSLSVRVIALSRGQTTVLLVTSETGRSFGPLFAQAIARHAGLPLDHVILTSTHTHAAPEITERDDSIIEAMMRGEKPRGMASDKANLMLWARKSYDATLGAVDRALASRRPASVGIGYGESYINVNRNSLYAGRRDIGWNPAGPTDHTLAVVDIVGDDGKPIACVVNYAVHGTVMHANTCMPDGGTGVSADIPGIVSGYLEKEHPGMVAMWLSGAAGDQNPIIQNDLYAPSPDDGSMQEVFGNDNNLLYFLSKIHNADVERTLKSINSFQDNPGLAVDYVADTIPGKEKGTVGINLQVLRLGNIAFACFSGELFCSTGKYMKAHSILPNTLVVNHCWQRPGQINGYCADDWTLRNGGFGQRQATFAPGYLDKTLTRMMNQCLERQGKLTYQKGDLVFFGSYPQEAGQPNGSPRLAWRVIATDDSTVTLITDKIVDVLPFNWSDSDGNDWATSNLRAWLNSRGGSSLYGDTQGFYDRAFSAEEKARIVDTRVEMNPQGSYVAFNKFSMDSPWMTTHTTGSKNTTDKVFALSGEEAFAIFGRSKTATREELGNDPNNYTDGHSKGTSYAVAMGLRVNSGKNGPSSTGFSDYWMRSPGAKDPEGKITCGVFLGSTGSLNVARSVTHPYGVRPVIRVRISSSQTSQ